MTTTTSAPALPPGYRLDEHLARGQSLDVYSAWSEERGCLCVVKTLRDDHVDDHAASGRLRAEGRLLCRLAHPNLVRGYELWEQTRPAVVLETLTGDTLGRLIEQRRQGLAAGELAELGAQLCSVLGYLHRHDILHLDLKPSNIVATGGRACLLDLSHARGPGSCPAGFGTREYMSPEQLAGSTVSPASDLHGLGGVLYRAATRHRPFPGANRERPDPTRRPNLARLRRRALPPALVDLVTACLEPDPTDRPNLAEATAVLNKLAGRTV